MKSPVMSRKDSYILNKISKEIHKCTNITFNPSKKLVDHCVEYKINRRNDEGCNPRPLLVSPFAWLFKQNGPKCVSPSHPGKLVPSS